MSISIALILTSFLAGIITVLTPCVLPFIPVIIGSSAGSKNRFRPFVIIGSLSVSVIVFTLLLKSSTLLIDIPDMFWKGLSGGIVLIFGIIMLFPNIWSSIASKLGIEKSQSLLQKGTEKQSLTGDIIIGAALGPVFSSCSPTYAIIFSTILPASVLVGMIYLLAYVFGIAFLMGLIGFFGQRLVSKLHWAANPKGWFKRTLAILLIIVGIAIISGYDKELEAYILSSDIYTSVVDFETRLGEKAGLDY